MFLVNMIFLIIFYFGINEGQLCLRALARSCRLLCFRAPQRTSSSLTIERQFNCHKSCSSPNKDLIEGKNFNRMPTHSYDT